LEIFGWLVDIEANGMHMRKAAILFLVVSSLAFDCHPKSPLTIGPEFRDQGDIGE
jgi:hypothetical protein